jgi:hypothetical protein
MPILQVEMIKPQDKNSPELTMQVLNNLATFLIPMNQVRDAYGFPMIVDSGWRTQAENKACGGAFASKHLLGLACDIQDLDGKLWSWVLTSLGFMQAQNLYFEDKRWTPDWVHFQLGAPGSGHRIFIPNREPPVAPGDWNGVYDPKFDGDAPVGTTV